MKIAMVKDECANGDKVTISGVVKWCGEVKTHQGQDSDFQTQSLLVADGVKTADNTNSIFCGFYISGNEDFAHLKNKSITLQGAINIYTDKGNNKKMELRSCKLHETTDSSRQASIQDAADSYKQSQNAQQGVQKPTGATNGPSSKDILIIRQCCIKAAATLYQGDSSPSVSEAVLAAQQFEDYVLGRNAPSEPEMGGEQVPPVDSEIPF